MQSIIIVASADIGEKLGLSVELSKSGKSPATHLAGAIFGDAETAQPFIDAGCGVYFSDLPPVEHSVAVNADLGLQPIHSE